MQALDYALVIKREGKTLQLVRPRAIDAALARCGGTIAEALAAGYALVITEHGGAGPSCAARSDRAAPARWRGIP